MTVSYALSYMYAGFHSFDSRFHSCELWASRLCDLLNMTVIVARMCHGMFWFAHVHDAFETGFARWFPKLVLTEPELTPLV